MPTLLPPPMPITPRDAPPPVFSPTPRVPSARNAPTPAFIPRPLPPILPGSAAAQEVPALVWFNESDGAFSSVDGSASVFTDWIASPVLAVAALIGELADGTVEWTHDWSPTDEGGLAPGVRVDGPRLLIYPSLDTAPGVVTVSATVNHQTYGPITLTLDTASAGGGAALVLDPLTWTTSDANETYIIGPFQQFLATVKGSWPEGAVFVWTVDDDGTEVSYQSDGPGLAVLTKDYDGYTGVFVATVTITAPGFDPQTLGPITLTVTNSGCC